MVPSRFLRIETKSFGFVREWRSLTIPFFSRISVGGCLHSKLVILVNMKKWRTCSLLLCVVRFYSSLSSIDKRICCVFFVSSSGDESIEAYSSVVFCVTKTLHNCFVLIFEIYVRTHEECLFCPQTENFCCTVVVVRTHIFFYACHWTIPSTLIPKTQSIRPAVTKLVFQ